MTFRTAVLLAAALGTFSVVQAAPSFTVTQVDGEDGIYLTSVHTFTVDFEADFDLAAITASDFIFEPTVTGETWLATKTKVSNTLEIAVSAGNFPNNILHTISLRAGATSISGTPTPAISAVNFIIDNTAPTIGTTDVTFSHDRLSNVDEVRSDTDSSKANVVTFTLTFSEPMHELEAADLTVEDASAGALTVAYVSGDKTHKHVYTATSPGALADGLLVVTVVASANDLAGNTLAADVVLAGTPMLDAIVPAISAVSFLDNNNEINGDFVLTFTVTSDDDLSVVDPPTATGFTFAAPVLVSGTTYTTAGTYQSGSDATLTITFPADAIKDSVKNGNQADTAHEFVLDQTAPVVQIEHTVYDTCVTAGTVTHCKESTLTFVVASSADDIAATPEVSLTTAQQWVTGITGGAVYVNTVTHAVGGVTVVYDIVDDPEFTISSGPGIFDVAGNVADTVDTNFLFDTTAPTLESFTQSPAAGEKSNTKAVTILATFSEPLVGITTDDVLYNAGSDFSQTRNANGNIVTFAYTFTGTDLDGSAATTITATASEGIDKANIAISNTVPNVVLDLDHTKPTATVTGTPNGSEVDGQATWTMTVTFDEVVKDLDAEHFALTNCEVTDGVNTGGNVWEVVVTPTADGAVSIDIAGDSVEDEHGNTLDAVTGVSYTYDGTAPTIAAQLINNAGSANVDFGSALTETELATFTVVVTVEDTNLDNITGGNTDIIVGGVASACTIVGSGGGSGASQTFTYTVSACTYSGPGQVDVTVVGVTYSIADDNNAVEAADQVFSFMYLGDVNTPPRIANTIADATVNVGVALTPIDASAVFADAESVPADLKWSAVQVVNGMEAALPTWLVFTAKADKTFTGTPAVADVAALTIRVKVVDPSGASASTDFQLTVGYGTLQGCRDSGATNYAPAAQFDGPCTYASQTITKTEGGVITQRNLKVTIPPNALRGGGSNAEITTATVLESSLTGLPAGKPVIAPVIQLGPSQTFAEPVEVCMDVPDYKFDRNTRSLVMYTGDSASGPWERTLTSSYDPVNKQLCGKTTHFSYFMGLDVGRQAGGGSCPNRCSGHGLCGPDSHCSCFRGYGGNDCSERLCKYGVAWVDENDMNPHLYAECSNNGECDRNSGLCQCFTGFEGPACDRTSCPNDCSGHGRCEFIQEFATSYDNTNWDHNKIRQCRCDGGYTGADCSGRICPVGDDPLTVPSSDEGEQWTYTIVRDLAVAGEYHLIIKDIFGNSFVSRAISYAATDADVKAALEATHGIVEIESVALDTTVSTELKVEVNLKNPPRIGDITAEVKDCADAGCFPKRAAVTGGTVTGSSSELTRAADAKLETATCSNRGVCDTSTGRCTCFAGHSGLACERQSMLF